MTRNAGTAVLWAFGLLASSVSTHAELFVTTGDGVRVFADNAGGGSAELRSIYRDGDLQDTVCCLALDMEHGELFMTDLDGVTVFAAGASGEVVPLRDIPAATTVLLNPAGLAVDTVHDELIVADFDAKAVFVFARTADGDAEPLRTISGLDPFGANGKPILVFLDLVHDELFVSVQEAGSSRVVVFDRTDSGQANPKRTITGFNNPRSVVVDLERDELFVTEFDLGEIKVFDRTASGAAPTKRKVVLPPSGTRQIQELVITDRDEMIVGVDGTLGRRVLGYDVTANGVAAPTRSMDFPSSFLLYSSGVVSTRAKGCSADRVVDGCLLRDGFEAGSACTVGWSSVAGSSVDCAVCGDGQIEGSETCDDTDTDGGDGCSAQCAIEWGYACTGEPSACATTCGDGKIAFGIEQCDDDDTDNDDGCSSTCQIDPGWSCSLEPSDCEPPD